MVKGKKEKKWSKDGKRRKGAKMVKVLRKQIQFARLITVKKDGWFGRTDGRRINLAAVAFRAQECSF